MSQYITINFQRIVKSYVPYGTLSGNLINLVVLIFILILIPFSVRYVFHTDTNFATGAYSDFTSFSLFLSDFFVIIFILLNFNRLFKMPISIKLGMIWMLGALALNQTIYKELEVYFSLRFFILLLFFVILSRLNLSRRNIEILIWIIGVLAVLQAFIAFIQFYMQGSIGLYLLGESSIDPIKYGVAKIVPYGTRMIRGYGTFPHPNLLAGFLTLANVALLYLLTFNYQKILRYILLFMIGINIFGLFITFSRNGILAFLIGFLTILSLLAINRQYTVIKSIILPVILSLTLATAIFYPFIYTRATISDSAVLERITYNNIGIEIIKDRGVTGTGLGLSVLHMEQYAEQSLKAWEIQPIHNYILISIAEWGIGAMILLYLIFQPLYQKIKDISRGTPLPPHITTWNITLVGLGSAIFILFMFDHYFYTIWPTQVLLWTFLALIASRMQVAR